MGDPFRVIPIRFLGHGFPIAASFGWTLTREARDLITTMSCGYIIFHALHRGVQSGDRMVLAIFETLIFDGVASILIPTFFCYHVHLITREICHQCKSPNTLVRWGPVIAGLATLAFTWTHIDKFVDQMLSIQA